MASSIKNWAVGTRPAILTKIHQEDINVVVYERAISTLHTEIQQLLQEDYRLQCSGAPATLLQSLNQSLTTKGFPLIAKDIYEQLRLFEKTAGAKSFRLLLATVNTNMCRRFHTDINDIRLLCTYTGPGTLWLSEDNINRSALDSFEDNASIVLDEKQIHQAKTGALVLLKGAVYPKDGTRAAVHRSPTIEESGEKRLLLRIDTHNNSNFWK